MWRKMRRGPASATRAWREAGTGPEPVGHAQHVGNGMAMPCGWHEIGEAGSLTGGPPL
jgi:hypothetical protein